MTINVQTSFAVFCTPTIRTKTTGLGSRDRCCHDLRRKGQIFVEVRLFDWFLRFSSIFSPGIIEVHKSRTKRIKPKCSEVFSKLVMDSHLSLTCKLHLSCRQLSPMSVDHMTLQCSNCTFVHQDPKEEV